MPIVQAQEQLPTRSATAQASPSSAHATRAVSDDGHQDTTSDSTGDTSTLIRLDQLSETQRRSATSTHGVVSASLEAFLFGDGEVREDALSELMERDESELPRIVATFPGPLLMDRRIPEQEARPVHEHGPMLALIDARLEDFSPQLWDCLERKSADARYYALRLMSYLRQLDLGYPLLESLFDEDAQVRALALNLIDTHRVDEGFVMALQTLHGRLGHSDPHTQEAAVFALTRLRDTTAIGAFIQLLTSPHAQVRQGARDGLMRLTFMDCGESVEDWQTWHALHRNELPLTWLVEAMTAHEPLRRELAARALQQTQGLTVNYHPDMSIRALRSARLTAERFFGLR